MTASGRRNSVRFQHLVLISIVLFLVLEWCWLFTLRITELSSSVFVGYLCVLFAFLVLVGLTASAYCCAARYFLGLYSRLKPSWKFLVILFFGWAALEWLVSWVVAVIWFGEGASLDTVAPFGSLTPILMYTPLRFLARLVGYHGLSAGVVVIITAVAAPKLRRYTPALLAGVVLAGVGAWLPYRQPTGPGIRTTVVAEYLEHRVAPLHTDAELVVLPEYGLDAVDPARQPRVVSEKEAFFVGSQRQYGEDGLQNVLVFGSSRLGVLQERPKSRLIPGGEYIPYALEYPLALFGQKKMLQEFQQIEAISPGQHNGSPLEIKSGVALGSAVCASIISTEDYREFTGNGATVLTNSASLAPFNSALFTFQHGGMARFMATANARPFLQSSNAAHAFALDHNGQLLERIHPTTAANVTIQANSKKTPYTLVGEWPVYGGLLFGALGIIKRLRRWRYGRV